MRKVLGRLGVVLLVAAAPVGVYLAPEPSPYPSHWDPRVLPIVHFVQDERGLTFEHPVAVELLDDKAFDAKLLSSPSGQDGAAAERAFLEELRALGLVDGSYAILPGALDAGVTDVEGVYVDDEQTVYVRGTTLTPYVRGIVAHELTHALQDQHFDLNRVFGTAGAEDTAVRSLVEGDAMRVETAYRGQLSPADKQTYDDEAQRAADQVDSVDVPALLSHVSTFPYDFGPAFVDDLLTQGGNATVDAWFRQPPRADAQVLDPETYPRSWRQVRLPAPHLPRGAVPLGDPSPFGKVLLLALDGQSTDFVTAWDDVRDWDGDVWQPYREGSRRCAAVDVSMLEDGSATRLAQDLGAWAKQVPGATVSADGDRVQVRSCAPGLDFSPATPEPDPVAVLAGRADVLHALMYESGLTLHGAECMTDQVVRELGTTWLVDDSISRAKQASLRHAFAASAQGCDPRA